MTADRPVTVEEYVGLRRRLIEDDNAVLLDKLDDELADITESDAERATEILQALTDSSHVEDRETAALFVGRLFRTRPDHATVLLRLLLQDNDEDVRIAASDTLQEVANKDLLSPIDAARLATNT